MKSFFATFIFLILFSPAIAQDIYVNNRPFKGATLGSGSALQLELEPVLKLLKLDAVPKGLAVTDSDGKRFVSLNEFAKAAGLKVIKNHELGTLDVYRAKTSKAPAMTRNSSSPEDVVRKYFATIKRLSKQCDFEKDADFDTYLEDKIGRRDVNRI